MATDDLIVFEGGALIADLLMSSDTTNELELTQHPIESGASIADHAILRPTMLELTLMQTESPVSPAADPRFSVGNADLTYNERPAATQSAEAPVPQPGVQLTVVGLVNAGIGALANAVGLGPGTTIKWTGHKSDEAPGAKPLKVQALQIGDSVARVNEFHDTLLTLWQAVAPVTVTVKGQTIANMIITSVKRTDAQGKAGCATFGLSLTQLRTVETLTVDLPPVPKATAKKSAGKVTATDPNAKVKEKTAAKALLFGD